LYEEWFTTSLLMDGDGSCCGVIARDVRSGRLTAFTAKNVILACGGAGQVYKPTTNGLIVTGDGIALAYRVGAPLMDMEMVQYHPTTLVDSGILITEGARGEGAHLLNADGGAVRGRRGGVRLGARRQPARRKLAAGHAHLRPPRRRARGGAGELYAHAHDRHQAAHAPRGRADRRHHRAPARGQARVGDQ